MGSRLASGNEEEFYNRARIEVEIHRHDLSLRKINAERMQLAEGLAENDFLHRLIMRRRRELCSTVDRAKARNRTFGTMGGLRQRTAIN